jgi:hypothetical protein
LLALQGAKISTDVMIKKIFPPKNGEKLEISSQNAAKFRKK